MRACRRAPVPPIVCGGARQCPRPFVGHLYGRVDAGGAMPDHGGCKQFVLVMQRVLATGLGAASRHMAAARSLVVGIDFLFYHVADVALVDLHPPLVVDKPLACELP